MARIQNNEFIRGKMPAVEEGLDISAACRTPLLSCDHVGPKAKIENKGQMNTQINRG